MEMPPAERADLVERVKELEMRWLIGKGEMERAVALVAEVGAGEERRGRYFAMIAL
jgi:hypothetical protein